MKIYTRTGDSGDTSLVNNSRISKFSNIINAVGAIDEANARLGSLRVVLEDKSILNMVIDVQSMLFDCGAMVADPAQSLKNRILIPEKYIKELEVSIDVMSEKLPPLQTFILPGGNEVAARAHLARSAVRSAERSVVGLKASGQEVPDALLKYLNRLSDWLFTLARWLVVTGGDHEILWQKSDKKSTTDISRIGG